MAYRAYIPSSCLHNPTLRRANRPQTNALHPIFQTSATTHSLLDIETHRSVGAESTFTQTTVPRSSSEHYTATTATTALILPPILHGSAPVDLRGSPNQMIHSLPPLNMSPSVEDRAPSPLPPLGHDISRPSSTSTQSSTMRQQQHHQQRDISLPGLSTLASVASAPSPQMRYVILVFDAVLAVLWNPRLRSTGVCDDECTC